MSLTLAGNLIYGACQWAMLIALAKVGNAYMVGQFALALAIVGPVTYFLNLQLRALLATDTHRQFLFGHYLALRIFGAGLVLLVVLGIVAVSPYRSTTVVIILVVAITKTFDFLSDIFYGLAQQGERMDRVATSLALQGVLQLVVLTVVVRATGSLVAGIFGMAAMSAAVTLGYDFRTARLILPGRRQANDRTTQYSKPNVFRPYWDIRALRSLLWIGIPMGLVLGLNALSGAVPRYVIASRLGTSQLGVFAAMIYLVVAAQQVTGALSDSATARLARLSAEGERRAFRLLVLKLVAATLIVGALGVLIAVVAGREILTILYRPQYGRSADTLIWVMAGLAPLLTAQVLGTATTAMRRFYVQVPFRVFQFGATWVLCTLLASEGLVGIGKAFFFASSLFALSDVILVIACERRLKQRMVVVGPMLARGS